MARWRGHSSPKLEREIQSDANELFPPAKVDLVLGPQLPSLVLDPNANKRRKKLEAIEGSSSDPVGREQQPPRDSALKSVVAYSLGAGVDADNPGQPAENEAVY